MNRRTSIKNILILGLFGTSISNCKWIVNSNSTRIESIYLHKELIAELAETIIPATNTPGAKDAKVEDFIIKFILEYADSRTQNKFLSGLEKLQEYSKNRYNKVFQACSLSDKISILEHYENKGFRSRILNKIEIKLFGESFFHKLKSLTTIGFCTSKIGATEALAYDPVPINYIACIPLVQGQKSWATN
jgi:hypothetical protein